MCLLTHCECITHNEIPINYKFNNFIKRYPIEKANLIPHMLREIACLRSLKHNNIIRLDNIIISKDEVLLVLEKCDFTLLDYMNDPSYEKYKSSIIIQLINSVSYLNHRGYVHCDLSLNNIMIKIIKDKPIVKIIDFNKAFKMHRPRLYSQPTFYIAPLECLLDMSKNIHCDKIDSWSLGCIIYILETKKILFAELNDLISMMGIKKIDNITFDVPSERISIRSMLHNSKFKNTVTRLLNVDPQKRSIINYIENPLREFAYRRHYHMIDNELIKCFTILINLCRCFRTDIEVIELAMLNLYHLKQIKFNNFDTFETTVYMFHLCLKIVTCNEINLETIPYVSAKVIADKSLEKEIEILEALEWNIDIDTVFGKKKGNMNIFIQLMILIMECTDEYYNGSVYDREDIVDKFTINIEYIKNHNKKKNSIIRNITDHLLTITKVDYITKNIRDLINSIVDLCL